MKKQIPNILTSLNLFLGCQSIVASFNNDLELAAIFIGIAAVLDFFDGFVARALNATGELGKQLDSLADVVSFGVAPGFIFYMLNNSCFGNEGFCINTYLPFLIPIFSALRLAKFNIDTRQSDSFIGLPTPANAIFIASIPFIISNDLWNVAWFFQNEWFLKIFPFVSAYLLVAELPLFALKFKNLTWKENQIRFVFILLAILSLLVFQYLGIAISIVIYILLSVYNNYNTSKTT